MQKNDFEVVQNSTVSTETFIEIRKVVFELNRLDRPTDGQTLPTHNAFKQCTSCKEHNG